MDKWSELKPGDVITVAVPQPDGSYDIQSSEVIQSKPTGMHLEYRYLKFKITQPSGKRQRMQCYIHGDALSHDVLFYNKYKDLTPELQHDSLIVSCLSDDADVRTAIKNVLFDIIADYRRQMEDILDKIYRIETKLKEL